MGIAGIIMVAAGLLTLRSARNGVYQATRIYGNSGHTRMRDAIGLDASRIVIMNFGE